MNSGFNLRHWNKISSVSDESEPRGVVLLHVGDTLLRTGGLSSRETKVVELGLLGISLEFPKENFNLVELSNEDSIRFKYSGFLRCYYYEKITSMLKE